MDERYVKKHFYRKNTLEMHTEMSEITVLNDINNFAPSLFWPFWAPQKNTLGFKKDGVQLVLSNLIKLYGMNCPLNSV